jgi:3-methyladenine DNA glycosylase/8-oxoguanine DNA glycosylase
VRSWRQITVKYGTRTPAGDSVFPSSATMATLAPWQLEELNVDAQRARTLIALARELKFRRFPADFYTLRIYLSRIPGVGPWTTETILGFGAGDPDAAPTGDLYLPHLVAYALAGEPRATDDRMLELLTPFSGHRFRVIRLLYGAHIEMPRLSEPRRTPVRRR